MNEWISSERIHFILPFGQFKWTQNNKQITKGNTIDINKGDQITINSDQNRLK